MDEALVKENAIVDEGVIDENENVDEALVEENATVDECVIGEMPNVDVLNEHTCVENVNMDDNEVGENPSNVNVDVVIEDHCCVNPKLRKKQSMVLTCLYLLSRSI
ncbi:hypothetical protein L2E82_26529 [Cichorium intybus]|uniref:Uncharacterized protein n=1 Tax=Cichorium intybus TaxID=13427 RepID=A0ACB9CQS5_CICIN|nr:hypothetical protein L2E82_26529 [Cichorium intybus]